MRGGAWHNTDRRIRESGHKCNSDFIDREGGYAGGLFVFLFRKFREKKSRERKKEVGGKEKERKIMYTVSRRKSSASQ